MLKCEKSVKLFMQLYFSTSAHQIIKSDCRRNATPFFTNQPTQMIRFQPAPVAAKPLHPAIKARSGGMRSVGYGTKCGCPFAMVDSATTATIRITMLRITTIQRTTGCSEPLARGVLVGHDNAHGYQQAYAAKKRPKQTSQTPLPPFRTLRKQSQG